MLKAVLNIWYQTVMLLFSCHISCFDAGSSLNFIPNGHPRTMTADMYLIYMYHFTLTATHLK